VTSALRSEALAPLVGDPTRSAVLLDIDGTLAPIVEHASDASVPELTRRRLISISHRYGLVACVSGRRASEARAMVSIGTISYLGSHGAELLRAGSTEAVLDPALEEWAQRIHEFGREVDTPELRRLRVRLEDKGPIFAFHWRGAPDQEAARAAIDMIASRAEATGTSLAAIVVIAGMATLAQGAYGNVVVGKGLLVGAPAVLGALAGTWLQQRMRTETIGLLFALLLVGVAVYMNVA